MKYNKNISDKARRRINYHKPEYHIRRSQLDLKSLIVEFRTIYGTYFRDIQIPNVSSSAIHGEDVDRSELFRYFESIGSISHIRTKVDLGGIEHKVGISSDYTITIYSHYGEIEELKIILFLKEILDKAILESPLRKNSTYEENLEDD